MFLYKEVLKQEVGALDVSWVKRPERLPVVLTRQEVRLVLGQLQGTNWLTASLLYGSGLRLLECLRLRVKDVDFAYGQIAVRDTKGKKDRVTMLPRALNEPLQVHLENVKVLHQNDLAAGFGSVYLPYALERKYPNAMREFEWRQNMGSNRTSVHLPMFLGTVI